MSSTPETVPIPVVPPEAAKSASPTPDQAPTPTYAFAQNAPCRNFRLPAGPKGVPAVDIEFERPMDPDTKRYLPYGVFETADAALAARVREHLAKNPDLAVAEQAR